MKEFGSPLLIIDCERVRVQYRKLQQGAAGRRPALRAQAAAASGCGADRRAEGALLDLATTGEVQLVSAWASIPTRCIHTHPIKRDRTSATRCEFGVRMFVADNPDEVRKFVPYADKAELLLRVSFRSPGAVCDLSRKFGCDPENCVALARLAAELGIEVRGLSFHVGSQAADAGKHVEAIQACAKLIAAVPQGKARRVRHARHRRRISRSTT